MDVDEAFMVLGLKKINGLVRYAHEFGEVGC